MDGMYDNEKDSVVRDSENVTPEFVEPAQPVDEAVEEEQSGTVIRDTANVFEGKTTTDDAGEDDEDLGVDQTDDFRNPR